MALLLLLSSSFGNSFAATVYAWTDPQGVRHFGDRPPALEVGRRVEVRQPNGAMPFQPLPSQPGRPAAPARPGLLKPPRVAGHRSVAQRAHRCRDARRSLRSLRKTQRRGDSAGLGRQLERRAASLARIARASCR